MPLERRLSAVRALPTRASHPGHFRLFWLPLLAAFFAALSSRAAAQPQAPTTLAVIPSTASGLVTLAWPAVPGALDYTVRRAPALTGPFTALATAHPTATFTDSTGTPGVFAYYVVTARDASGESPASPGAWAAPVIILDNAAPGGSAPGVSFTGTWATSGIAGSHGTASVFANVVTGSTPTATYTFTPVIPARGRYDVYLRWTSTASRAPAAAFDFVTHDSSVTLPFNQTLNGNAWNLATSLVCEPGATSSVTLRNNASTGNVSADAVQFIPRHAPLAPEAERPHDYSVPVLLDHFEGAAINPALWKQFLDRPHFSVSDGKLRLRLVWVGPRPLAEATPAEIASDTNWNEGGITSQHSQKFGYHEARFRIPPPSARGVDTAYWHLATDAVLNGYEIDAPEFFNKDASGTNNNFGFGVWDHYPPTRQLPGHLYGRTWDYTANNSTLAGFAPVSGFITVGLEWRTDNTQVVYINGRKLFEAPASGMNDVESILPTNSILSTKILNWMNPAAGLDGAEALWDYALYYQKPGWLGTSSTSWSDPANWGPDGLPGPGRAAVFNVAPPSASVTLPTYQSLVSLSLDDATLPALTFSGPGALRLGVSVDPTLTHGGILLNTAISTDQTFTLPIVGAQDLQFANLSRTPGVALRLDGLISGDGLAPRDIDFVSSTAANVNLGPIVLGQPLGPGLRHVNRVGDGAFTLPAGSQHTGELRIARGTVILPDATALGLDPTAAIVFKPNHKHSEAFRPRLRYLGPAATFARPIHIAGWQADAVIEANGTGPLTLTGPVILQPASADPLKVITRDLRLALNALSSSGDNILAAALSDRDLTVSYSERNGTLNTGPATLSLTKSGAGTWVLTGDNHLAEPVIVWGGRLVIGQGTSGSLTLRTSPRTGAAPGVTVHGATELVFGRDDAMAFSTRIAGAGGLRQRGAGTLTLGGAHAYTGSTTVQTGTLRLDGALTGGGPISVASGAMLTGDGSTTGPASIDGTVQVSPLSLGGALNFRAIATLRAAFTTDSSPSPAGVSSGSLAITAGARVQVALDAPGSTADLRQVFWRSARSFPLINSGSRSGTFSLAPVSADSVGNSVSNFGSFSLQHTATGVNLLWTPALLLSIVSPSVPVVSLPDTAHALRLHAVADGPASSFTWQHVSGPGSATFTHPNSLDTLVTFSASGTHVVRLTATHALGSLSREVTINVAPPVSLTLRETTAPSGLHPATFIRGDSPAWNSGARDQVLVGRNNGAFRALLAFDLTDVPPGSTIASADLDLWAAGSGVGTSVGPLNLHRLLAPFVEGTGDGNTATNGTGSGADWAHRAPATPWTSAGAADDSDSAPLQAHPALNPTATNITGTRLTFVSTPALSAAVQASVFAGEPIRFLLRTATDTTGANAFIRLASDDHTNSGLRPRLTLGLSHASAPTLTIAPVPLAIAGQPVPLNGSATGATSTLWMLASGPASAAFVSATAPATEVTFPLPGDYVLRFSATNTHGESARPLAVSVLPERAAWRQIHFGTTANTGDAADLADPDGDGVNNLLEYALGTTPTDPASVSLPTLQLSSLSPQPFFPQPLYLQLSFLRARSELTYLVEASSTLAPESWTVIATNPGQVGETVTVTDPEPVSENPRRFLRLRVTAP